jgi:Uma2 family endonuclease
MSLAEFLAWEERQELRFEFDGIGPVAMNGGTVAHEMIGGNLRASLERRLEGTECYALGTSIKIEAAGRIRYPDVFVACGAMAARMTVVPAPVIVFEVVSASTSRIDRIEKLRDYQATPSILRYVIVEQDSIAATVCARRAQDWIVTSLTQDDKLDLPEIGISQPLAEIYRRLSFPEPHGDDDAMEPR